MLANFLKFSEYRRPALSRIAIVFLSLISLVYPLTRHCLFCGVLYPSTDKSVKVTGRCSTVPASCPCSPRSGMGVCQKHLQEYDVNRNVFILLQYLFPRVLIACRAFPCIEFGFGDDHCFVLLVCHTVPCLSLREAPFLVTISNKSYSLGKSPHFLC